MKRHILKCRVKVQKQKTKKKKTKSSSLIHHCCFFGVDVVIVDPPGIWLIVSSDESPKFPVQIDNEKRKNQREKGPKRKGQQQQQQQQQQQKIDFVSIYLPSFTPKEEEENKTKFINWTRRNWTTSTSINSISLM